MLRTAARAYAARHPSSPPARQHPESVLLQQRSAQATWSGSSLRSVLEAHECPRVWVSEQADRRRHSHRAHARQPEADRIPRQLRGWPRDEQPTPLECWSEDRTRSALVRVEDHPVHEREPYEETAPFVSPSLRADDREPSDPPPTPVTRSSAGASRVTPNRKSRTRRRRAVAVLRFAKADRTGARSWAIARASSGRG